MVSGIDDDMVKDALKLSEIGCVLVRRMMRSAGAITQRFQRAIITPFPAINILPVSLVFDGGLCNPKFISIFNKR